MDNGERRDRGDQSLGEGCMSRVTSRCNIRLNNGSDCEGRGDAVVMMFGFLPVATVKITIGNNQLGNALRVIDGRHKKLGWTRDNDWYLKGG